MIIEVKWQRQEGVLIARLLGRIDSGNAADFLTRIEDGIGEDDRALVLDFERVSYIASAGLRVCLVIAKRFVGPDKDFALCALGSFASTVVEASGFDKIISVHDSASEAIRAFKDDS